MKSTAFILVAVLAVPGLFLATALRAQEEKPAANSDTTAEKSTKASEQAPPDSTTQGSIDVGGQHIAYTAIAGTITVGATDTDDAQLGPDGKPLPGSQLALAAPKEPADAPPVAHMFYVAYFKTGANAEDRPITFFYNGGPGSSTMWLHMGSLGPKYVETAGDTHLPGAPYKLIDNTDSLLDVSDEVFIDMPGTGFGRLAGKDAGKAFWGVDQDAEAFARFIARFLVKYGRWNSPKFLFGESYGTTRSAVLAEHPGEREERRPERSDAAGRDFQLSHGDGWTASRRGFALRAGAADLRGDGVVSQETVASACLRSIPS